MPTTITRHARAMSALADASGSARALAEQQAAERKVVADLARPLCPMSGRLWFGAPRRQLAVCPKCMTYVFVTSAGKAARHAA